VVYGLMKIADGVSVIVPGWEVVISLLGYTLVYGALMIATVYLLAKYARAGAEPGQPQPEAAPELQPALVGAQD
jgi:cytochrome bd ubiquinol oxidase subunit I